MKTNTEFLESIKDKKFIISPHMFANEISRMLNTLLKSPEQLIEIISFSEEVQQLFCDKFAVDYVKQVFDNNIKSKPGDPEDYQ